MVGSPEELGLLLEMAALFEELPFLEVRPLSESACCNIQEDLLIVLLRQSIKSSQRNTKTELGKTDKGTKTIIPDDLPGLSADGPAFSPVLPPGGWKQENALVSFIITKKSEK
ncbi:hypothetical protein H5410_029521 [Solanum commersonii]|uniref:Uncharacterized protein n=1 Tax=Solanum commersonii TaxID=4109 RepID=A0A9J5YE76_SOLCO|nr:hypothetical protein H5410_029521 [Solanum commersonii]